MTLADKDGKLLNTASIITNLKPNSHSKENSMDCYVSDPSGEQLKLAYVNSIESSIKAVSSDGNVALKFVFKDKSSLLLKIMADSKVKENA
jgi:hypothetical protein